MPSSPARKRSTTSGVPPTARSARNQPAASPANEPVTARPRPARWPSSAAGSGADSVPAKMRYHMGRGPSAAAPVVLALLARADGAEQLADEVLAALALGLRLEI